MDHVVVRHLSRGGISRVEQTADPPLELDHPCVGHRLELSRAVRARAWLRIKDEHRKESVPHLLEVHGLRTDVRPVARCNRQWRGWRGQPIVCGQSVRGQLRDGGGAQVGVRKAGEQGVEDCMAQAR